MIKIQKENKNKNEKRKQKTKVSIARKNYPFLLLHFDTLFLTPVIGLESAETSFDFSSDLASVVADDDGSAVFLGLTCGCVRMNECVLVCTVCEYKQILNG